MTVETLENELKKGSIPSNIFLLYGEERFLLENAVKRIKKNFGEIISRNKLC